VWQCVKCGQSVEDDFDVCWSCGTSRDGVEDPSFQTADDGVAPAAGAAGPVRRARTADVGAAGRANRVCTHCGSGKIIPGVSLLDHYGDMGHRSDEARAQVLGAPEAWIFTDPAEGRVSLDVCGECGRAEVRVHNARELWEKYQRSRRE
jgi:hypothetical protein